MTRRRLRTPRTSSKATKPTKSLDDEDNGVFEYDPSSFEEEIEQETFAAEIQEVAEATKSLTDKDHAALSEIQDESEEIDYT